MKNSTKILGMTAAVALLSTPVIAGYNTMEQSAFDKIDTNNNGRITMNEFENNTIHHNEAAVFKMYDQDNNGYVTREELYNNSKIFAQPGNISSSSNLKTKDGKSVGSMDAKFYNTPEVAIDNPFINDPKIENDINWEWPKDFTWNDNFDTNKPIFNQLDTNNNGMISQKEFMAGALLDNEAAAFAMLDRNESGEISAYELKTYSKTGGKK